MKAVELYRNTKDVLAVQRALGHASLSATQTYLAGIGALGE
jgi:site-specific recombinase XerD